MITNSSSVVVPRWVWVVAVIWTVVALGVGVWVALSTGEWMVVVLAIGLTAPLDVMLIRRRRGMPVAAQHG